MGVVVITRVVITGVPVAALLLLVDGRLSAGRVRGLVTGDRTLGSVCLGSLVLTTVYALPPICGRGG
ncbi:hypothetical protein ACOMHN_029885 [Nucella lapillus]